MTSGQRVVICSSDDFRAAIRAYEADLRKRTGSPLYRPFVEAREALARAVDALDLTPAEWGHLRHRIADDGDEITALASILTKARGTSRDSNPEPSDSGPDSGPDLRTGVAL